MSSTIEQLSQPVQELTATLPEVTGVLQEHEATLRHLLGPEYAYAQASGLLDMFYFNPEDGRDGLLHILVGDMKVNEHGLPQPEGYHVELAPEDAVHPDTYVDNAFLKDDELSSHDRRKYVSRPYEPSKRPVVIRGFQKYRVEDDGHGNKRSVPLDNSMFPKEYGPMAVLQTVRQALGSRERTADKPGSVGGTIVTKGYATMLDGKTKMPVRLILDRRTEKVLSAYPLIKESGYMRLGEAAIQEFLYS